MSHILTEGLTRPWPPSSDPRPWRSRAVSGEENAVPNPPGPTDRGHTLPGDGGARFQRPGEAQREQGVRKANGCQAHLPG